MRIKALRRRCARPETDGRRSASAYFAEELDGADHVLIAGSL
jgi:hypothetical protein